MTTLEEVRDFALSLPHVTEDMPFGDDVLVFRIGGRIFLILSLQSLEPKISVKCLPERAIQLRDHYDAVEPGYHLDKRHWNTIYLERDLPKAQVLEEVTHSYEQVALKLPRSLRRELNLL